MRGGSKPESEPPDTCLMKVPGDGRRGGIMDRFMGATGNKLTARIWKVDTRNAPPMHLIARGRTYAIEAIFSSRLGMGLFTEYRW